MRELTASDAVDRIADLINITGDDLKDGRPEWQRLNEALHVVGMIADYAKRAGGYIRPCVMSLYENDRT